MIKESTQEEACLYVLGLLPEPEAVAFEIEMMQSSELRALVAAANNATLALAQSAPQQVLSGVVKKRLLASLHKPSGAERVVEFPKATRLSFLPWAIAACLLGVLAWQLSSHHSERASMLAEREQREADLQVARGAESVIEQKFKTARTELEQQLEVAQADRNSLMARFVELEKKDSLAQSQIAVLGSLLKDRPQAVAVSVWNQESQSGQLVVENLPILDVGRDYQLWIIDPDIPTPISAGVFKVDIGGKVRISFRPDQAVQTAAKFAVTEETEGGVASPTMDQMVVIGGS